jgi:ABC-type bacteriocin/lantibiotic exporter with double-glycine peptidase domain
MGTTVLVATHAIQRLSYGDHIIVLASTGRIIEQGSFDELKIAGGYVQGLAAKSKAESIGSSSEEAAEVLGKPLPFSSEAEQIELTEQDLTRQTGDIAVYKYYFAATGWISTIVFVGFCILFEIAAKLSAFLLTYWTQAVSVHGNSADNYYLGLYAMMTGLSVLGIMGSVIQLALRMVPRSAQLLHARLLETVMRAPLAFFTTTDTGTITNR